MTELVAEGAYAVGYGIALVVDAVELDRAGVEAYFHTVVGDVGVAEVGLVGPQVAAVVAAVVGAVAGHYKVDHVDIAVAVVVILAEVDRAVELIHGRAKHVARVVAAGRARVVDRDGAHHVELRGELAVAVLVEVVAHTAQKLAAIVVVGAVLVGVARVVFLVVHACVELLGVAAGEGAVVVVDQDDEAAELGEVDSGRLLGLAVAFHTLGLALGCLLAVDGILAHCAQERRLAGTALCSVVGHLCAGLEGAGLGQGVDVVACLVLDDGVAVGSGVEVVELVAVQHDGECAAVGLCHCRWLGVGRHGLCLDCGERYDGKSQQWVFE